MKGLRPSSSERLAECCASACCALRASNSDRNSDSSARKFLMRSWAFSCLAVLSSCFASALYSSSVLEKAVSEADMEPRAAGVSAPSADDRFERSRLMDVDCLSAELNWVF